MAKFYYGMNRGGNGYANFSVGTSTTGKEFEIVVDNASITDRQTVFQLMELMQDFVVQSNWPPA